MTPGSGGPADPGYPAGTKPERGPEPTETGAAPGGKDEAATPAPNAGQPSPSPEGKGYSANPLRQAKACFRAGRYQQGLDILEAVTPFTEGDYWRAKLLDRLGRTDEALLLFASVEVAEDAGPLAAAAKRDAEFQIRDEITGMKESAFAEREEHKAEVITQSNAFLEAYGSLSSWADDYKSKREELSS